MSSSLDFLLKYLLYYYRQFVFYIKSIFIYLFIIYGTNPFTREAYIHKKKVQEHITHTHIRLNQITARKSQNSNPPFDIILICFTLFYFTIFTQHQSLNTTKRTIVNVNATGHPIRYLHSSFGLGGKPSYSLITGNQCKRCYAILNGDMEDLFVVGIVGNYYLSGYLHETSWISR